MKKVIVKKKVIDIPYAPATETTPEQLEVSHLEEIREPFQCTDEDLPRMLAMEAPDVITEVIDITAEHAQKEKEKKDKKDREDAFRLLDFSKDKTAKELTASFRHLIEVLKDKGIL